MKRIIKAMENKYLTSSLELVEDVFAEYDSPEEAKVVRHLVEELRSKKYYIPKWGILTLSEIIESDIIRTSESFRLDDRYILAVGKDKDNNDKLFILFSKETGFDRIMKELFNCGNFGMG